MTETVNTAVPIKIFFQGEIRRFNFVGNFQTLLVQIQELLKVNADNLSIRFEDDEGDWVTIASDVELIEALKFVGSRALRLRVVDKIQSLPSNGPVSPSAKPWKDMAKEAKVAKMQWKHEHKAAKMEAKMAKKEFKKDLKHEYKLSKEDFKKEKTLYGARFVKHVSVDDNFEFAPSTPFAKIWRFRNEGTMAWPEKSALICVGKKADKLGAVAETIPLNRTVMPGEEIDVSVQMVAPSVGGTYFGYWKLADLATGKKFGPRVRVLIKVVDSSSSSSDEGNSTWGEMMTQLESMGFTDKALNVKLLVKTHGNMDKIVRKLLKRQEKKCGVKAKKV